MNISTILTRPFYGNNITEWTVALCIVVGVYFCLLLLKRFLHSRVKNISKQKSSLVDQLISSLVESTKAIVLLLVAIRFGVTYLDLPVRIQAIANSAALISIFIQIGLWLSALVTQWTNYRVTHAKDTDASSAGAYNAIKFFIKLALWSVIVLFALSNLGFDITALVAGLGVGSIAVALAVQNILGDIFCSISILLDKPFEVGDFIVVGNHLGTVDQIGIKSTRLISLQGEQIVISNADLIGSRIQNFKRMKERRILFSIGVTYDTKLELLKQIPEIIKFAINSCNKTRFDRAHFKEFGAFSLNYEIVYFVLDREYMTYMDAQQQINLEIFKRFNELGIEFAFPTQTLHLEKSD
jgi:small-conductance mechanosensitive channel